MPNTKVRVVGSGFTTLSYRGKPIAWLESFQDTGQQPVTRPEFVHLLGDKHPTEIVTARALSAGSITITIRELWNAPVWQQLPGLENANNIIDVYEALAADPSAVSCQMLIKPPGENYYRGKTYMNCTITSIDDSETVTMETLSIARVITMAYTHTVPIRIAASSGA